MAHNLVPKFKQPITGILAFLTFSIVAIGTWFIFSDPRGPVGAFPYPFVMYLAMMILVGLWQHMFFNNWPFDKLKQPFQGIVMTIINLVVTVFVVEVVFYRVFGLAFNFLSQVNLNEIAATGKAYLPDGTITTLEALKNNHLAQSAIVSFVLIGFFSYPLITILFEKWPVRPSNLVQPHSGILELAWCSLITLFLFVVLIVPFWGMIFSTVYGNSVGFNTPWWGSIAGTTHVHWVFGWWEWIIVYLFLTANVWRGKPWTLIKFPQPYKGLISFSFILFLGYVTAIICTKIAPLWLPSETIQILKDTKPADAELIRFLWYHSAEIAGFMLMPFLIWHHYFEDAVPFKDKDSWASFAFRTVGVFVLGILNYVLFYYANFGYWGLGNHHMEHLAEGFIHGESLVWNFWWIIPLLWHDWFFAKWGFFKES